MQCIPPTKGLHLTYSDKCATDLQYVGYTNFFQSSVYPRYSSSDQQQLEATENHVQVGPKYRRTDVT